MLESLHQAGCQRDRAGNRKLHMDQYMSLLLLYMFNPICTSLRAVQQASELKKVQRKLGCPRASLGSLSEAATVFDSALMQEIVTELSDQLRPISSHAKLDDLAGILTAVDGTLINALPKMTWALWRNQHNAIKAHTQFDIEKHVPIKITITQANASEIGVLAQNLEPGRIYVKDRGYAGLALFEQILEAGSSFVCRLKENSIYECLQDYELTSDALAAGIVFDKKVRLGCNDKIRRQLAVPVRLIAIKCTPHKKRNKIGCGGPKQGEMLLIATNIFDLEADVIGLIFKHRWAVEVYQSYYLHCHSVYYVLGRGFGRVSSAACG